MEAVAARAASKAVSSALTLFALFLVLLFRAFPSPVPAPPRQDPAAASDETLGTERGDHDDRTELHANKPTAASRRDGLRDGDVLGDAPDVAISVASQPDSLRSTSGASRSPLSGQLQPRHSRNAEPRTSRGPPASG